MLEDQVGDDIAGHPVGQEKLEGFHYAQRCAGSAGVTKLPSSIGQILR